MIPLHPLVTPSAQIPTLIEGNLRVQILSSTLVRIEEKGPQGYEDRPTFHVVERNWPGSEAKISRTAKATIFTTANWRIVVPKGASNPSEVRVEDRKGTLIYQVPARDGSRKWIPTPGKVPAAWSFGDSPRIVPAPWGATPAEDDSPTSGWTLNNSASDVYVFLSKGSYPQLRQDFLRLTGPAEMPPLYMLGLIDSKYHPYYAQEALDRVDQYRQRRIPLDVLTIDTDWRTGGSHGYTPDPKYFPNMPDFIQKAKAKGVRLMFNDHPEPMAPASLDPVEMRYRYKGLSNLMGMGMDVWWYDRNWSVSLHEPAPGLPSHLWGMRVYHDMTQRFRPDERPVIMGNVDGIDNGYRNRPPDVSAHRFSVQWTGDTLSRWDFLQKAVSNAVQGGVEGLNPWINDDLGGHVGDPGDDLYVRFMQFGSLSPVMRPHCTRGYERAPWTFGPDAEKIVGDYVRLRYRLLPLLYASARDSYENGEPILRRLDIDYPTFAEATREDQYLIGKSLLVAPIVDGGTKSLSAEMAEGPWKAEYFANEDLSGTPRVTRSEAVPGFDLTSSPVAPGVPVDNFTARWTGRVKNSTKEAFRLSITSDDGVRVWVDDKLVVDQWKPLNSITNPIPVRFEPGQTHSVRIEYMEMDGGALMRLGVLPDRPVVRRSVWVPPGTWRNAWTGESVQGPKQVETEVVLSQVPMFIKTGAIIPTTPVVQKTADLDWKRIVLDVYPGANGQAELYEDDGHSVGYQKGQFRRTPIRMTSGSRGTDLRIAPGVGTFPGAVTERGYVVRFHLPVGTSALSVRVNGQPTHVKLISQSKGLVMPFDRGASADGEVAEVVVPPRSTDKSVVVSLRTQSGR